MRPTLHLLSGRLVLLDPYYLASVQAELPAVAATDDLEAVLEGVLASAGVPGVAAIVEVDPGRYGLSLDRGVTRVSGGCDARDRFGVDGGSVLAFDLSLLPAIVRVFPTRDRGHDRRSLVSNGGYDWTLRVARTHERHGGAELRAAPVVEVRGGTSRGAFVGDGDYAVTSAALRPAKGGHVAFRRRLKRFGETVEQLAGYRQLPWPVDE